MNKAGGASPMSTNRLLYLWCLVVTGGIISVSVLHSGRPLYQQLAIYGSNRWVHFVAYALLLTIPIAIWQRKSSVLLSFVPALIGIALESFRAGPPWSSTIAQTIPADLFGVAAGILLGLNIRTLRNSALLNRPNQHPTRTTL
jgi:hypothetical protein